MTERDVDKSPTARWLMREHGAILRASVAAKILGFESTEALRRARIRQTLPIPMFTIEGRRGWFASTAVVAAWIDRATVVTTSAGIHPHE